MHTLRISSTVKYIAVVLFGIVANGTALLVLAQIGKDVRQDVPQEKIKTWKIVGMGELEARDGTPFSFKSYMASDGATVTVSYGDFTSAEKATAELNFQKKEAQKIIKEGSVRDAHGRIIGHRVVALRDKSESEAALAEVFWTEGLTFYSIISPSLEVALEWEKKYSHWGATRNLLTLSKVWS